MHRHCAGLFFISKRGITFSSLNNLGRGVSQPPTTGGPAAASPRLNGDQSSDFMNWPPELPSSLTPVCPALWGVLGWDTGTRGPAPSLRQRRISPEPSLERLSVARGNHFHSSTHFTDETTEPRDVKSSA